MGKRIKKGQQWLHTPSNGTYTVIGISMIKIPHVGWFKSVTYTDGKKMFNRFREDFENKFEKQNGTSKPKTNEELRNNK